MGQRGPRPYPSAKRPEKRNRQRVGANRSEPRLPRAAAGPARGQRLEQQSAEHHHVVQNSSSSGNVQYGSAPKMMDHPARRENRG